MNSRSTLEACTIRVVATLLAGLVWPACAHKPEQQLGASSSPAGANDAKMIERMEKARARALQAPGGSAEASDFASQVTVLFTQGVSKRQAVPPALIDEVVKCIDQAKEAKPDDAPDLLARKGELLIAAGKGPAGAGALRASITAKPSLRAFTPLARYYAAEKLTAEAEVLCKKTLPAMKSDESRYAVLDECLKCSGAVTPEAGLRWATTKDIGFYKNRRKDLEARLEAAKQARSKEAEAPKKP
jgi:hypothetical protein